MTDKSEVVLRLEVDRVNHGKVIRVGVKRPNGSLHWVCEWLCGKHVDEKNVRESSQVADDLWIHLLASTVGIASPML